MTILDVQAIREGVLTPAVLEPQLTSEQVLFGLTEGRPFEQVVVPPGEELGIQFVGTFGDCETVAEDWLPSSGLSIGQAFLTVRWGVLTSEAEVSLMNSLNLEAPMSCP
jgi:hypothetical protein